MQFTIVRNMEDIEIYEEQWKRILLKNNNRNPFIEYEWIRLWWRYLGNGHELFIIVISLNSAIIGFCPFMLTKKGICAEVNFIGYLDICYMDFIIFDYFRKSAIEELLNYLTEINKNYVFNLHGMAENGVDYQVIEQYFAKRRLSSIVCKFESRYIDTSSGDFDSYYKERCIHRSIKNIGKCEKKLKKIGDITYKRIDEKNIDNMYMIHNKRWHKKNDGSNFSIGKKKELFRQLIFDSNLPFQAKADGLFLNDRLIAFKYGFTINKRHICLRVAHDDTFAVYAPGKIIYKEKIKECFEGDIDICEFGAGGFQQNKADWTDCVENINRILFPAKNKFSHAAFSVYVIVESLKKVLRKNSKVVYFKMHTLGIIKYFLSKSTFYMLKKAISKSLNTNLLKELSVKLSRYYHYRWEKLKFDVYQKQLSFEHLENDEHSYSLEYSDINEIEYIMELMQLEAAETLRRLEKGNKCIRLIKGNEIIAWAWINEMKLRTRVNQDIRTLEKGSVCIYDNRMKEGFHDNKQCNEVVTGYCYLFKKIGCKNLYFVIEKNERLLTDSLNKYGFMRYVEDQTKKSHSK